MQDEGPLGRSSSMAIAGIQEGQVQNGREGDKGKKET
jgi:hypothetical protein